MLIIMLMIMIRMRKTKNGESVVKNSYELQIEIKTSESINKICQ
jgi:hypothetical protein